MALCLEHPLLSPKCKNHDPPPQLQNPQQLTRVSLLLCLSPR